MGADLLDSIHQLIYNNVYCSNPNDPHWGGIAANGYERRIIGFRAEIECARLLSEKGARFLDGGWMLSTIPKKRCLESSVYFTVSRGEPSEYTALYSHLARLGFLKMFFIKYGFAVDCGGWQRHDVFGTGTPVIHPAYDCFEFSAGTFTPANQGQFNLGGLTEMYRKKTTSYRGAYKLGEQPPNFVKSVLGGFTESELAHIMANRFVFDALLGMNVEKGIPSDIDFAVFRGNNLILLEVKEKDLSKREPVGFGMDIPRIGDMALIEKTLGVPYYYVVKQVDNQINRNAVAWWLIDLKDFVRATHESPSIEGGTGMATASGSKHPTVVAPLANFSPLDWTKPAGPFW